MVKRRRSAVIFHCRRKERKTEIYHEFSNNYGVIVLISQLEIFSPFYNRWRFYFGFSFPDYVGTAYDIAYKNKNPMLWAIIITLRVITACLFAFNPSISLKSYLMALLEVVN